MLSFVALRGAVKYTRIGISHAPAFISSFISFVLCMSRRTGRRNGRSSRRQLPVRAARMAVRSLLVRPTRRRGPRPPRAPRPVQPIVVAPAPAPAPSRGGNIVGTIARGAADFLVPGLGGVAGTIGDAIGNFFGLNRRRAMGGSRFSSRSASATDPGDLVFEHKEYLGPVSGSTEFENTAYLVNPGLSATFPFLSKIARNWQEYQFDYCEFKFGSRSSDALNSTNTALGSVVTATNYNCCEADFTSKQQMEVTRGVLSERPSISQVHGLDVTPQRTPLPQLYIRSDAVPSNQDQHLYDLAKFQIATEGMQAAAVIGELWVHYRVILRKPRLDETGAGAFYHMSGSSAAAAHPLGADGERVDDDVNTLSIPPPTATSFFLPFTGRYYVRYALTNATGLSAAPTFGLGFNLTAVSYFAETAQTTLPYTQGTLGGTTMIIDVSAPGTTSSNAVTVTALGVSNGFTDLFIIAIPAEINHTNLGESEHLALVLKRLAAIEDSLSYQPVCLDENKTPEICPLPPVVEQHVRPFRPWFASSSASVQSSTPRVDHK